MDFIPLILGFMVGFIIGMLWIMNCSQHKDQIVKHGGGEYYLDDKHKRRWRWIDHPKPTNQTDT